MVFEGLRRIAPITQILLGSDWPFSPEFGVERNIATLKTNDLSEADQRAIARENAERLFPAFMRRARA